MHAVLRRRGALPLAPVRARLHRRRARIRALRVHEAHLAEEVRAQRVATVALPLHYHYVAVTLPLRYRYITVAFPLHDSHGTVTLPFRYCCSRYCCVTVALPSRHRYVPVRRAVH